MWKRRIQIIDLQKKEIEEKQEIRLYPDSLYIPKLKPKKSSKIRDWSMSWNPWTYSRDSSLIFTLNYSSSQLMLIQDSSLLWRWIHEDVGTVAGLSSVHSFRLNHHSQLTSLISLSYLNLVGFLSLSIFLSVPDIYKPILRSIHYSFLFSTFLIF